MANTFRVITFAELIVYQCRTLMKHLYTTQSGTTTVIIGLTLANVHNS